MSSAPEYFGTLAPKLPLRAVPCSAPPRGRDNSQSIVVSFRLTDVRVALWNGVFAAPTPECDDSPHMFKPIPVAIGLRYLRAKRRNGFISFISLASILG